MASDAEPWFGLHPASVVVNLVPRTFATLRSAWPLLLAFLYGQASGQGVFDLGLLLIFFGLAIGNTVVHFLTLRYRFAEGRLEIRSGLLNRQARVIAAERVQNVELVRNVFHRMSGLVEVRIETASGAEVEGLLSALSVPQAEALVAAIQAARGEARADAEPAPEQIVVANGTGELLWFGATGTRFGAVALLLGFAYEALTWQSAVDPESLDAEPANLGTLTLALATAAITGAWLLGVGTAHVHHHGFRLVKAERSLVAEQGLLTRRRAELRLAKVQLVTIVEPWLRRLVGFGSVWIETAAAREGGDGTERSEAAVPFVERDDYASVVGAALPLQGLDPMAWKLLPPHPASLVRAVSLAALRALSVAALGVAWFGAWGLPLLVIVPIWIGVAVLDVRTQGFLVTEGLVVSRRGFLDRRTALLARGKLQSASLIEGPVLRLLGLGVLQLRVAGSRVVLPALARGDADALLHELVRAR